MTPFHPVVTGLSQRCVLHSTAGTSEFVGKSINSRDLMMIDDKNERGLMSSLLESISPVGGDDGWRRFTITVQQRLLGDYFATVKLISRTTN